MFRHTRDYIFISQGGSINFRSHAFLGDATLCHVQMAHGPFPFPRAPDGPFPSPPSHHVLKLIALGFFKKIKKLTYSKLTTYLTEVGT